MPDLVNSCLFFTKNYYKILYHHTTLTIFAHEKKIPHHYIKYIREGIYEFRVNYGNNEFRLFFIYDGNTIVVLFNGIKKKTQKTPQKEIQKAIRLKNEYYEEK
jgi:putative addiction module killer protein